MRALHPSPPRKIRVTARGMANRRCLPILSWTDSRAKMVSGLFLSYTEITQPILILTLHQTALACRAAADTFVFPFAVITAPHNLILNPSLVVIFSAFNAIVQEGTENSKVLSGRVRPGLLKHISVRPGEGHRRREAAIPPIPSRRSHRFRGTLPSFRREHSLVGPGEKLNSAGGVFTGALAYSWWRRQRRGYGRRGAWQIYTFREGTGSSL